MQKSELEIYLQDIKVELFDFAYVLIPDELQAQQVVVDAICAILLSHENFIKEHSFETYFNVLRIEIYKGIFQIASKRFEQLPYVISSFKESAAAFYRLESMERAILFLNQAGFSSDLIGPILQQSKTAIIATCNGAKDRFFSQINSDGGFLRELEV